ncbi:MAG: hypothetical protein BHV69_01590 [Bacteroidales bacterium 52_46]|nr:MAG: hypothetical protein BHV69_01590 [Bacteroidales bacterium 52_46]
MKEFLMEHFFEHGMWIVLTYVLVVVAMAVDLVTGVRKSRKSGHAINSRGYKRTCRKAMNYFLPMMCLSCIDVIASAVVGLPVLTMVFGAYCVFCELKSVMETTHDKEAIRNDVRELLELGGNIGELREMIRKLIK